MKSITYKQSLDERQIPFLEDFLEIFYQVVEIITLVMTVPKTSFLTQVYVFIKKLSPKQMSLTT